MRIIPYIFALGVFVSCESEPTIEQETPPQPAPNKNVEFSLSFQEIEHPHDSSHFRGLYFSGESFHISGTDGIVLEVKEGKIIRDEIIDGAMETDLRDIHTPNASSRITMSIASPGMIWTDQFGDGWTEIYHNPDPEIFFDGMDFWNEKQGLIFGDPLRGEHLILKTLDGGKSWKRISPEFIDDPIKEGGFAASGTSIVCLAGGRAIIGFGGEKARVLHTNNYGSSWRAFDTPIAQGSAGRGIYSIDFRNNLEGVAVGGNWEEPECDSSKIYSNDGGMTWQVGEGAQEYRSCVTHVTENTYVATGTSGTDISYDGGKSWQKISDTGFNSIAFNGLEGVAVGSYGKIATVQLSPIN